MASLYWLALWWCFQQIITIPDENYFKAANQLYDQAKYKQAAVYYEQLFDHQALGGMARYNAGNIAYQQKKYQLAFDYYEQALQSIPDDEDVWHNMEIVRKQLALAQAQDDNNEESTFQEKSKKNQKNLNSSISDQLLERARSEEYRYQPVINQQSLRKRRANFSEDVFNLPPEQLFRYIKEQTQAGYPFKAGSSMKKPKPKDTVIDW